MDALYHFHRTVSVKMHIVILLVKDDKNTVTVPAIEQSFLDRNVLSQPMAAMVLVSKEIYRAAELTKGLFGSLRRAFVKNDSRALEAAEKNCLLVDGIGKDTVSYISSLFSMGGLTEEQSAQTAGLMYVLNDIVRISVRCKDMLPIARKSVEGKTGFSEDAVKELGKNFELADKMYGMAMKALEDGDAKMAYDIMHYRKELRDASKKFNKNHLKRLKKNSCKPEMTYPFANILHILERIGDGCGSMAEGVFENVSFISLLEENAHEE